jgi:hypothetical protein
MSLKLSIGTANDNQLQLEPIDVANWNTSFRVPSTKWEYTVDSLAYFLGTGLTENFLIDVHGNGLKDVCEKRIQISSGRDGWDDWAEESFPTKILRQAFDSYF